MAATKDIVASYRGPGRVVRRILDSGAREDRVLLFLMLACLLLFVGQTPRLAREAFETDQDLGMLMGASLMALIFIAPLVFYLIAGLSYLIAKLFRSPITAFGARLAMFWALLAASPLILLWGLTAGFVGPGPQLTLVGLIWFGCFMWFWIGGFMAAARWSA